MHSPLPARLRTLLLTGAVVAATAPAALRAQGYFGQNQVQFQNFEWRVLKTEHFDVHYYQSMAEGARIAARMAERSYARLSRLMGYQFKERKPIVVFASRGDFAQNNVTGDLGESTGGVTDALRQRNMFFFGGDLAEVEHVMTHEMVHQFQYDIFARGHAGSGLQQLASSQPPLWFNEGMAEYLSVGPNHPATDAIVRDAALNGNLPTIEKMTNQPNRYFPYRYGESFWSYIGSRWGDEIIGEIMQATTTVGVERAFKRHTGFDLDELSDEWRETMQTRYLPTIGGLDRPRKVASPLLNEKRTGGIIPVYVAPALSPDGRQIAYISTGSLLRAEVFLDLYLADATTGKRTKRLTKSTLNADFEELRYAYSQSAFSPDGRELAFTAQRSGKDVIYVLDVRSRNIVRRFDTDLDAMVNPSWSPDGKRLVFSGQKGGLTNIYTVDADGRNLRALTQGWYAGLMPQWSPDGRKIVFVSDRGPGTDIALLRFGKWRLNLIDLETGTVETIPGQGGKNLNPMWAPDGKSVAFVSDRTGIPQVFLYDLETKEHYQLTKFIGGVQSVTENSPAISWARQADKLAFTYFDNGDYTIWSLSNPRQLKKEPYRDATPATPIVAVATRDDSATRVRNAAAAQVAALAARGVETARMNATQTSQDTTGGRRQSVYRTPVGLRTSSELPAPGTPGAAATISVAALLDSASLSLPEDKTLKDVKYDAGLRPEYVARPQIGYAQDNYGRGVFGGTAVVLADMIGNRHLTLAGAVNGRIEEAQVFAMYSSNSKRFNYNVGLQQDPYFYLADSYQTDNGNSIAKQTQVLTRLIARTAFFAGLYPLNRFTRFELGAEFRNLDRANMYISRYVDYSRGLAGGLFIDSIAGGGSLNYAAPFAAFVQDNTLFGGTGPIYGHRYRAEVSPNIGKDASFVNYLVDFRRYDAMIFSLLTLATRVYGNLSVGPGEAVFPKYLGQPTYIRGYDRENYVSASCGLSTASSADCSANQLLGSRVALVNAELRFPLVRRFDLGVLPIALPPVDGLFFYDAGMAWNRGQSVSIGKPDNYNFSNQRYLLRSYGYGLRVNLFNMAVLRWDYAIPLDGANVRKGYWWWTIGSSF
jgi:dipeptidyl aminopeptidase/acylaminoacyl peptidase